MPKFHESSTSWKGESKLRHSFAHKCRSSQCTNTPTNTSRNTHASITFVTVAIIEKQLKARHRIHNIDNIATKPHLNRAIIMSSCKLSKQDIILPTM